MAGESGLDNEGLFSSPNSAISPSKQGPKNAQLWLNKAVYFDLRDKVANLPKLASLIEPIYIIFSLSGFSDELLSLADGRSLILISGDDLLE